MTANPFAESTAYGMLAAVAEHRPAREAIDAFVDRTQELVTGEVRLELRPSLAVVTGRRSEHMLYAEQLASYGAGETFPHEASEGFLRIVSLEAELAAARARAKSLA